LPHREFLDRTTYLSLSSDELLLVEIRRASRFNPRAVGHAGYRLATSLPAHRPISEEHFTLSRHRLGQHLRLVEKVVPTIHSTSA
jgi:hypothetical protein